MQTLHMALWSDPSRLIFLPHQCPFLLLKHEPLLPCFPSFSRDYLFHLHSSILEWSDKWRAEVKWEDFLCLQTALYTWGGGEFQMEALLHPAAIMGQLKLLQCSAFSSQVIYNVQAEKKLKTSGWSQLQSFLSHALVCMNCACTRIVKFTKVLLLYFYWTILLLYSWYCAVTVLNCTIKFSLLLPHSRRLRT